MTEANKKGFLESESEILSTLTPYVLNRQYQVGRNTHHR